MFQNWDNIQPETYDKVYYDKYAKTDARYRYLMAVKFFMPMVEKTIGEVIDFNKTFLEIGDAHDWVCNYVFQRGWKPTKIDINVYSDVGNHPTIIHNFETYDFEDMVFDCVWASHVFEHFKEPVKALQKTYDLLNPNGCVYISMPDTFYLIKNGDFGHLQRNEHHIMWLMEKFIEVAEKIGFNLAYKGRNEKPNFFIGYQDCHIILRKGENNAHLS